MTATAARADWSLSQLERQDVACPRSLAELDDAVAEGRVPFAGGTDLLIRGLHADGRLPPLCWTPSVPELKGIDPAGGALRLGAAASLTAVARAAAPRTWAPAVAEAAELVGSVQIRNRATIAGNVCNASPAADTVPALAVHETVVAVRGGGATRTLPLRQFLLGPGRTALRPGEYLEALFVQPLGEREASAYRRFTARASMDLAFVGVGVWLRAAPGGAAVEAARLALGAVGPTVEDAPLAAAALVGRPPTADVLLECGELAAAGCHPIDDLRASAAYRRRLVSAMVREAVAAAWLRAGLQEEV